MNIAIYGRNFSNNFTGMAIQLFEELHKNKIRTLINAKFNDFIRDKISYTIHDAIIYQDKLPADEHIDFLLSIGGDGTFLEAATYVGRTQIPLLGINTGRLGFLSYVNSKNLLNSIRQLLCGEFSIEARMMLEVETQNKFYGDINFCVNEFTVQKKTRPTMIRTKVYANNNLITTYWSDGIIVATPTGSTAYSLSCGGPIVEPNSDIFLITPIANHNLTVRPLIIPATTDLKITLESLPENILLSMDYRSFNANEIKEIKIKQAKNKINIVKLFEYNYFNTLNEKLCWGVDIRN
jgi:NAD+ kinase